VNNLVKGKSQGIS